ncbi:hypothetical protein SAMN05216420_10533 [Nitrosospira sp. Nl5]|uniref:hypothetical protein n=1 Tax=Nitrosospira sp. Nl5 TaxID=200120 RepID=UPI00088DF996|nr:hypothetical protein [Nitrosospira sp. Nl5]SCY35380.1 hypothetical protein SAMN05216420_10533 [Nitrosospira sp. Nl5]
MKHTDILPRALARSVVLAGILIFAAAGVSHAQSDKVGKDSASTPETPGPKAAQSGRENSPGEQKNTPAKKDGDAPDQLGADVSPNEDCEEQEADACEQPAPEQKSFLRRIMKLFYGPDRPPGPDPDVDTNISAGGAGGG